MNSNELTTQSPFTMETALPSSLRRRLSSSVQADKNKMADVKDHVGKVRQLKRQLEVLQTVYSDWTEMASLVGRTFEPRSGKTGLYASVVPN
ncbi:hypothetical protein DPMN_146238 [Dreissena polymorpha]|uniref:Uncharacterized protein n=1 Tax=Dreissena polymorpha TaxID=45954 RepID=A0A9D4J1T4_DREPO|nr:hypothetical protein DPMN_146238 [Dreissena polymorpha]